MGNKGNNNRGPQKNYSPVTDENFINPYNFVPTTAPDQNINAEEVKGNTHKGYFTCQLITKTPLAIPDVAKKETSNSYGKEHDKYPFMTLGNKQMIPGSSLRGVIRNIYETATNSCMITVAGDDVITARANGKAFKAGLLIKDDNQKWTLYSAKRIPLVIEDKLHKSIDERYISFKNENPYNNKSGTPEWKGLIKINGVTYNWGDPVWVDDSGAKHFKTFKKGKSFLAWDCSAKDILPFKNGEAQKPGYKKGYLYLGEAISNKHAESVFIQGERVSINGESPNYIKKLDEIYAAYNDKAINRNLNGKLEYKDDGKLDLKKPKPHFGYQGYSRAKKNGVIPIWYEKTDEGKIHVSFAAIGRMAYDNSFSNIPNVGRACKSRNKICKACALFGMVGDKNLGSKVRFTDAILTNEAKVIPPVLLKELGSPKPSYLPFYTKKAATYDDKGIEVRGRKFYWHNPKANKDASVYTGDDASRSSEMELLDTGSKFEFKVYYDGIADEELETLAWALTLGDNDPSSKYCIKIGHGKPIGLGSSKIIITECVERNVDVTNGSYSINDVSKEDLNKYIESGEGLVSKNRGYKELMQILDFNGAQGLEVRYPYITPIPNKSSKDDNSLASHQWFTENRGRSKDDKPGLLPSIDGTVNNPLHPYELSNGGNFGTPQKEKSSSPKSHSINATANLKIPAKGEEFEMTVKKINKKGNYILGKEGNVTHILYADKVKGDPLNVKDKISVGFSDWRAYDDGNVNYIYNFIRKI